MNDFDERPVRLVLDTSAIAGFVAGSIAPGELLAEIDAEGGTALVPYPCLVEAAATVSRDQGPWIGILLRHPATRLGVEDLERWAMFAGVRAMLGTYEPAAAAWAAVSFGVEVLTRHPQVYAALGEDVTIPFDE